MRKVGEWQNKIQSVIELLQFVVLEGFAAVADPATLLFCVFYNYTPNVSSLHLSFIANGVNGTQRLLEGFNRFLLLFQAPSLFRSSSTGGPALGYGSPVKTACSPQL